MIYQRLPNEIKSILRYPGGKSKAIKHILPLIPMNFSEFREPFVGGGSIFIAVKQRILKKRRYIINDINSDLMCFWNILKKDPPLFKNEVEKLKNQYTDGKQLFNYIKNLKNISPFEKAIRYFILNRISFSGLVDAGGYSNESFEKRFNKSVIDQIIPLGKLISDVEIEQGYYKNIIDKPGKNIFIFIDPPYMKNIKSKLYGRNGILHEIFDHEKLAYELSRCSHRWLATLDDCREIREYYNYAYIYEWTHQYGMNNVNKEKAKKGKELFISNFKIHQLKQTSLVDN